MIRAALALLLMLACSVLTAARATDLNLYLGTDSGIEDKIVVCPGAPLVYTVSGHLSDTASQGLAGFSFDLTFSGGEFYLVYLADIQDPGLLPSQPRTRKSTDFYWHVIDANWLEDGINVYFVGNVQPTLTLPTEQCAESLDPRDVLFHLEDNPFILINDGGYNLPQGFADLPSRYLAWHIVEHEMTHFLARFFNTCYPLGSSPSDPDRRCYNYDYGYGPNEHVPPSHRLKNILSAGGPPHVTRIPGRYGDTTTEKGEIWDGIWRGDWLNP